jgi:hypothetical protein
MKTPLIGGVFHTCIPLTASARLARESGGSGNVAVEGHGLIAGKPAPTGFPVFAE